MNHKSKTRRITRRRWLVAGGSSILGACGGSAADSVPTRADGAVTTGPAESLDKASSSATQAAAAAARRVPYRVVIEDHRSATPVDAGALILSTVLGDDSFAHPQLKQESSGWREYGRNGAPLVFDGIEFDAWRFSPRADGIFARTQSHRVLVLMRAADLTRNVFGDPRGKRVYAPPFKVRVEGNRGELLARVEMRDGLALNHASLPQDPRFFASEAPADLAKLMRRHVCAGFALPISIGGAPLTSIATRNRLPRAKTGDLSMPTYLGKSRAAVNGAEMMILASGNTGGNGNAHPYVMPRWALSRRAMDELGSSLPTQDPELVIGNGVRTWESALSYGWDYEPGNYGGITNRAGPGGIRGDRTSLPAEYLQMFLRDPGGARAHDGAKHQDLALAFVRNTWNYATYRHAGTARLSPIDPLIVPFKAPSANSGSNPGPQLVAGYYSRGNATFEDPVQTPDGIWSLDSYGESDGSQWQDGVNPLDGRHPTAGWNPDGEHSHRLTGCFAAWIYADPIYARMQEFLLAENAMEYPAINTSIGPDSYYPFGFRYSAGAEFPGFSRTTVLRLNHLATAWGSATERGTFTRAVCEGRLRAIASHLTREYRDTMPTDDATPARLGWHRFATDVAFDASLGWCLRFPIHTQYIAEFMLMARAFGLTQVLLQQGTDSERDAWAYIDERFTLHLAQIETWLVRCPWKVGASSSGELLLPLRSPAQGAVQADVNTIPTSWDAITAYAGPNPRNDGVWHVGTDGQRNTQANYMREMSPKIAFIAAEYLRAPADPQRAANLAVLRERLLAIDAFTRGQTQAPRERNGAAQFNTLLHAWPQSVPALDV